MDAGGTAAATGLPAAEVESFALEYARTRPTAIRINYGLNRHAGGGMAVRTIVCLPAVTGAWREVGGGVLLSTSGFFPVNSSYLERPDLIRPGTRTINMVQIGRALTSPRLEPRVMAVYVYNSNPLAVAPEQASVQRGFTREDLFTVVHDLFRTDTVDHADIVLPATHGVTLESTPKSATGEGSDRRHAVPRATGAKSYRLARRATRRQPTNCLPGASAG